MTKEHAKKPIFCSLEKIILRSRSNRKNKTSGSVVPGSFKIFQNTFESLGFIHIKHTLKQQLINHIDLQNMLASCYLISQIKTAN